MSKQTRNRLLVTAALCGISSAAAQAQISIDWYGGGVAAGGAASTAMTPTQVAGLIPLPNWNSFTPPAGGTDASQPTPQPLVDSAGLATGASVTWVSNNTWNLNIPPTTGDAHM